MEKTREKCKAAGCRWVYVCHDGMDPKPEDVEAFERDMVAALLVALGAATFDNTTKH